MTCTWTEDSDGVYQTACGHQFQFFDGTPEDNGQKFCGYCGGLLMTVRYIDAPDSLDEAYAREVGETT